MSFDLKALRDAVERHGRVVRVVIAAIAGSSPREVGTAMLVWNSGQSGTVGGGALEWEAALAARAMLTSDMRDRLDHRPLGPALGQCCGGSVTLLSETYDADRIAALDDSDVVARAVADRPASLAVTRLLTAARNRGAAVTPQLLDGWMIEPVSKPGRALWVFGAGHVGRALVHTLSPLPDFALTWIDTADTRFPDNCPETVTRVSAEVPSDLVRYAPVNAEHLIVTYSHAMDLELCHAILSHGFRGAGLIGSRTKWARFRRRLAALGHSPAQISRISCPIGDPAVGKHPQAIAVSVAGALLRVNRTTESLKDLAE